jgi:hypothetical protein
LCPDRPGHDDVRRQLAAYLAHLQAVQALYLQTAARLQARAEAAMGPLVQHEVAGTAAPSQTPFDAWEAVRLCSDISVEVERLQSLGATLDQVRHLLDDADAAPERG